MGNHRESGFCMYPVDFDFMISEKQRTADFQKSEFLRPEIERTRIVEISQLRYFKNASTLKKSKKCICQIEIKMLWIRGFAFFSTGNKRLWFHSKLIWIWFDEGRLVR